MNPVRSSTKLNTVTFSKSEFAIAYITAKNNFI